MEEVVYARYLNPWLNIALKDWREVYLLGSAPQRLLPEVHRGKLVYRARGSSKRVSYERIKKGLVKKGTPSGCTCRSKQGNLKQALPQTALPCLPASLPIPTRFSEPGYTGKPGIRR